jgi:nucleoside-diphosphate-sugar epimerase
VKVLLTGATGFLGGAVMRRLLAAAHEVVALVRRPVDLRVRPYAVECRLGDVTDAASMREAVRGCRGLVHVAGLVSAWRRNVGQFHAVNIRGVENAVAAAEAEGCEKVVVTASIIALGPSGERPLGASDFQPRKRFLVPYEETKHKGALVAMEAAARSLPVVTLCPGVIYGPRTGDRLGLIAGLAARVLEGKPVPLLRGGGTWCFSFVEDVAEAHLRALERKQAVGMYVLGGENATLARLYDVLERLTGRRARRLPVPAWVAKGIGAVEVWGGRLYLHEPNLTPAGVQVMLSDWAVHSEEAVRDLEYPETTLREGLGRTLDWIRARSDRKPVG